MIIRLALAALSALAFLHAAALVALALIQPVVEVSKAPLRQMVSDLEAIPTRDPALRTGRAARRQSLVDFERFRGIEQRCHVLEVGISRRAAARFKGDGIFDDAIDSDLFEGVEGSLAPTSEFRVELG